MNYPAELKYTKSHEWVKDNGGGKMLVGLSDFAQSELGDLVFVSLPEEGDSVSVGESFADVESVKAVSDVYSPLSGSVVAINEALLDDPALINSDPYGSWMIEVEGVSETADFLSAEEYEAFVKEEG